MWQWLLTSGILLMLALVMGFALTAAGMLVLFGRTLGKRFPALDCLKYSFVFLTVYAWYSLWTRLLLPLSGELQDAAGVIELVSLLGTPFLFISLLTLLAWLCLLQQRPLKAYVTAAGVAGVVILAVSWQLNPRGLSPGGGAVVVTALCLQLALVVMLVRKPLAMLDGRLQLLFPVLVILGGCAHALFYLLISRNWLAALLVLLLFQLCHTAFVVLYVYKASLTEVTLTFDDFFSRFGISPREADVVQGIYKGRTNQEIADSLFISLQTVKDHTSRIYQKVQVRNRGQLTTLLRESLEAASGHQ